MDIKGASLIVVVLSLLACYFVPKVDALAERTSRPMRRWIEKKKRKAEP